MAEGVPRERRATTCRGDGSERRSSDPTVDLQKEITALAGVISRMVVQVATLTKQIDDERNIRANQQQIGRGPEQRRGDCQRSKRYAQRRRYSRHAYSCYACGKLGHIRRECTRFASEQSREHVRASRYSGNIQQSRRPTLGENARAVENFPTTKRIVSYQKEAHVHCDMQRYPEMDHEKGRRRDTRESRSGESCAVSTSERHHLSAEKHKTPIGTSVSCQKQTRVSRHTKTLTIQDALPVVSVSPRSHPERPHNVADETSREDPVKHDIVDVDGGHKTSDERPKTVRSMLPRKARHDANVTECTLAIGDFVFIRDRTCQGRNEIQNMWRIIVYVVMCVPYDVSNVYVVMPATGGLNKTLNRAFLLPARPPVTDLDHSTQEDSLSDDDAIPLVPEIATDPPDSEGMVEAVSTQHKHATWWRW